MAYHLGGKTHNQIAAQVNRECEAANISELQVLRHLQKNKLLLSEKKSIQKDNALASLSWSLDEVRKQLIDTVTEVRDYIERHEDNPRAVAQFLKVRLDALDKIARLLGGYAPEQQVNVQVNTFYSEDQFEKLKADAKDYFGEMDAEVVTDAPADL